MFMSFQCTSIPKWDFYRNLTSNQPFHVAKKLFLLRFVSSGNSCCLGRSSDWDGRKTSWWLNQPIWTILVKLDHFPKDQGENKQNIWNHHLENFPVFSSRLMDVWGTSSCVSGKLFCFLIGFLSKHPLNHVTESFSRLAFQGQKKIPRLSMVRKEWGSTTECLAKAHCWPRQPSALCWCGIIWHQPKLHALL